MTNEEAIEHIKNMKMPHDKFYEETNEINKALIDRGNEALEIAIESLENQKTGHWIRITNGALKEKYICSECGRQIEDYGVENLLPIKYPYCHCGAKMEGNKE